MFCNKFKDSSLVLDLASRSWKRTESTFFSLLYTTSIYNYYQLKGNLILKKKYSAQIFLLSKRFDGFEIDILIYSPSFHQQSVDFVRVKSTNRHTNWYSIKFHISLIRFHNIVYYTV